MNPATRMMVKKLGELADAGFSVSDAAKEVDAPTNYVRDMSKRHRIGFPIKRRGRPPGIFKGPDARSEHMRRLYLEGQTLQAIGDAFGITRERVRQILTKQYGIRAIDGGQTLAVLAKRRSFSADRDARLLKRWGCTYSQYRKILKHSDRPTRAFSCQRKNAERRGIAWELTLWQWWQIWQQSGHWSERGRGRGFQMCRLNDVGPYSVDNVYIATGVENIQDHWVNRKAAEAA